MVEHLEKSSPLVVEEVRRLNDLIWYDYLSEKYSKDRAYEVDTPSRL